jgi:hypothetical protein
VKKIGYVLRWILTVFFFVMVVGAGAAEGAEAALLVLVAAVIISPPVSGWLGRTILALRAGWITIVTGLTVFIVALVMPHPPIIRTIALLATNSPAASQSSQAVTLPAQDVAAPSAAKSASAASTPFPESAYEFDKDTKPYKAIVMKGVERLRREDARCAIRIDPNTAELSIHQLNKKDPEFAVICGATREHGDIASVRFTASEVASPEPMKAPVHINLDQAEFCHAYAKGRSAHPSTVDFKLGATRTAEAPNGNTDITDQFTAKNSFNLELTYNVRCLFNEHGFIEANVEEARD